MNKKTKTILGLLIFAVFIIGAYFAYNTLTKKVSPSETPQSSTNTPQASEKIVAPDFTVTDIQGNEVRLSDFKGKPIVINFWTSWCSYCKIEMPYFDTAYNNNQNEVVFLMVDVVDGQRETIEKGQKFISDQGYTFPIYFDTTFDASSKYGINSFPTTLFIDKEGNISHGYRGAIDEQKLLDGIKLIKE